MMLTSRTNPPGLFAVNFFHQAQVDAVVVDFLLALQIVPHAGYAIAQAREARGDEQGYGVAASAGAVGSEEDVVAGLGAVEHGCQPQQRGAGVGIADVGDQKAGLDLLLTEAEFLGQATDEFGIGLVEDRPTVVFGLTAEFGQQRPRRAQRVVEVGGLASEAVAVLGVVAVGVAEEVGRVSNEGE